MTFNQDYMCWITQGDIAKRHIEKLGESDRGIILFRKMLLEQVYLVGAGQEPTSNIFRDPAENVNLDVPVIPNEAAAKEQRTLTAQSTSQDTAATAARGTRFLSDLGLLVVSCEHGEMRQSPAGIYIYNDAGTTEVPLTETSGALVPELDELHNALVHGKSVLHDGRWGLATLEVCLAIMQSATAHQDIPMQHQVAVPYGA